MDIAEINLKVKIDRGDLEVQRSYIFRMIAMHVKLQVQFLVILYNCDMLISEVKHQSKRFFLLRIVNKHPLTILVNVLIGGYGFLKFFV